MLPVWWKWKEQITQAEPHLMEAKFQSTDWNQWIFSTVTGRDNITVSTKERLRNLADKTCLWCHWIKSRENWARRTTENNQDWQRKVASSPLSKIPHLKFGLFYFICIFFLLICMRISVCVHILTPLYTPKFYHDHITPEPLPWSLVLISCLILTSHFSPSSHAVCFSSVISQF